MNKLLCALTIFTTILGTASTAPRQRQYIDPMGGYTQVVTSTDRGVKTVYVSGQIGTGEDFSAHTESAFAELVRRLGQAGATINDVVKIRVFVRDLDPDLYRTVADVRRRTFPRGSWPASTVAGVDALAREPFRIEVEAVAVVAEAEADLRIERFSPANGLSGAVATTAHGVTTIYVSGQVGAGDGLGAQAAAVWERVGERLNATGASYADLVKTTTYIVNLDPETDMSAYRGAHPDALLNADEKPASTLLGVPSLAAEHFKIEIDAVAIVGAGKAIEREFIDPARTYTQAVTTRGDGPKTVHLAGQVGRPGDSLADQADQVYANLLRRLEASGASPADLLKITVYIPGYTDADLAVLGPAREKHGFAGDTAPASTLLGIQSLYSLEAAIEIEGIAVVDRQTGGVDRQPGAADRQLREVGRQLREVGRQLRKVGRQPDGTGR